MNDRNIRSEAGYSQRPIGSEYNSAFSQNMGYDFSSGMSPKRKRNGNTSKMVACIILCVLLSFGASFGGTLLARKLFPLSVETEGTEIEALLLENPDEVLDKKAPTASVYGSAGEEVFAVSDVVRMVQDAVVVIKVSAVSNSPFGGSTTSTGAGSGVIVSEDGYVLTCYHVVEKATSIKVTLNDGTSLDASLVGGDEPSDLAMLKINAGEKKLTFAKQGNSCDLVVGESVIAVGNPLGILGGTVTTGIISSTERSVRMSDGNVMTLIQTDTAINSGNSGGGLFNRSGELIGIVNAKYSASGVEGIAFAIPIDSAYPVQLDLLQYGYVRGVIDHGLSVLEVTNANLSTYYYHYGITETGVYIVSSEYSAELKNRDRILSINGEKIATVNDMKAVFAKCSVGDTVTLEVAREDATSSVTLTLREYVPDRLKKTD